MWNGGWRVLVMARQLAIGGLRKSRRREELAEDCLPEAVCREFDYVRLAVPI